MPKSLSSAGQPGVVRCSESTTGPAGAATAGAPPPADARFAAAADALEHVSESLVTLMCMRDAVERLLPEFADIDDVLAVLQGMDAYGLALSHRLWDDMVRLGLRSNTEGLESLGGVGGVQ